MPKATQAATTPKAGAATTAPGLGGVYERSAGPAGANLAGGGAVMSAGTSMGIPAMPPPRVLPFDLAMTLPELWRVHNETDAAMVGLEVKHRDYRRGERQMRALEGRIEAVEEMALESPAQSLADAITQLIVMLPRIREQLDLPCTARTLAGMLRVMMPLCSEDFSKLLQHYTPVSEEWC